MSVPSKIICVGRNYVDHAAELGSEVPDEPLIFFKPPSAVVSSGDPIRIPEGVGRVDYEGEIGLRVGIRTRNATPATALKSIDAVLPMNDVTARDLQAKDDQWARAKGFDTFCGVGPAVPVDGLDLDSVEVVTRVNGEERQRGRPTDMAFSPADLIVYISGIMTLEPGDLIATGTPEGVGALRVGDTVEVELVGLSTLRNSVEAE
ncbi:MAG: fumarylacetoacetate hydrolase family protein [Longimicrobiales bacterium]|nr:fumarylacetoacetate hydrolase family protein [Longimicrobiales bacterium]